MRKRQNLRLKHEVRVFARPAASLEDKGFRALLERLPEPCLIAAHPARIPKSRRTPPTLSECFGKKHRAGGEVVKTASKLSSLFANYKPKRTLPY